MLFDIASYYKIFNGCGESGLEFMYGWVSDYYLCKDMSRYKISLFSPVLTAKYLCLTFFYWLAIHSNRYWPHNIGFLLPPICPHLRPRKFQIISPRLYLQGMENLKPLRVHAAFNSPSKELNIILEFSFILYILIVKFEEKGGIEC